MPCLNPLFNQDKGQYMYIKHTPVLPTLLNFVGTSYIKKNPKLKKSNSQLSQLFAVSLPP